MPLLEALEQVKQMKQVKQVKSVKHDDFRSVLAGDDSWFFCTIRVIRPEKNSDLSFLKEPNKNLTLKSTCFRFSAPLTGSTAFLTCQEV
jgi:hypothetical protein